MQAYLSFAQFPGEMQFLDLAHTDRDQRGADDLAQEARRPRNLGWTVNVDPSSRGGASGS